MCKLEVNINQREKNYPIFITNQGIENLKTSIFEQIGDSNYIAVISQRVFKLYSKLLNFPREKVFILKDGEKEKNINNYTKILDFALCNNLTRKDSIVAIGGGVVGDLAGFAASTYMRGINYIQVPTTLLACTDSSVGGKTAINTKYGKNLVGAFYQPKAVFINVNFLKTLDQKQFKSGLGEVVKYGFIEKSCTHNQDLNLINFLNENIDKILKKDILTLRELIEICVKLKISVVEKDEKETGLRQILNLGHTFAHSYEKISNYKYTHGQCVAQGVLDAFNLAFKLGKINKEYLFLAQDLISKFNFVKIPKYDKDKIINTMSKDKKNENSDITLILPTEYSQVGSFKFSHQQLKDLL